MSLLTNLVSYWKLDGNSTDSVGSNSGTDTAITYNAGNGKINQGAGFNGTTSIITGGNVSIGTNATISCWFKTTIGVSFIPLFGFTAQATIYFIMETDPSGKVRAYVADSNGVTSSPESSNSYNDGNWHLLVLTKASNVITLYADAIQVATDSSHTFTGNFNNVPLMVGNILYNGSIDECGYWSRALSSTEVAQLYNFFNGNTYPFSQEFNMLNLF